MTREIETLTKLLAMTTSSNDHECLVAIRKVNAMLAARNMTWELFIKGRYPKEAFSEVDLKDKHTDADEINEMFTVVMAGARGTFSEFIDSIHTWWEEKGFLTEKQYSALKSAYNRGR